jgi:uncharacterized protein with FMN-binding domain
MESDAGGAKEEENKRSFIKIALIVGVVFLVAAGWLISLPNLKRPSDNIVVRDVDLSRIPDGTYTGTYTGGEWSNTVSVTVKDHKITSIKAVKQMPFAKTGSNGELFKRVISKQTPNVDTITGATITSKAYLKSIENALSQAR